MQNPEGSNFISHVTNCKKRDKKYNYFPEWTPENLTTGEAVTGDSSLQKQRKVMKNFSEKGLQNPTKEFSRRVFRELLSKGSSKIITHSLSAKEKA